MHDPGLAITISIHNQVRTRRRPAAPPPRRPAAPTPRRTRDCLGWRLRDFHPDYRERVLRAATQA